MTAKRWFIIFLVIMLVAFGTVAALNLIVDPFSVFGDRLYSWYSYGMTNNPKTAKFAYVDNRPGQFDAFIVGPSGTSGISPLVLEEYTGLRWYNMFNYGADLDYTERLIKYLVSVHDPEKIILCLPVVSARSYGREATGLTNDQPLKMFWRAPFVFANPKYSMRKIDQAGKRSYFQSGTDVFDHETGTYNKTRRDAEAIGDMERYLENNSIFAKMWFEPMRLKAMDETVAAVESIIEICERNGTELTVITTAMIAKNCKGYNADDVLEFYERISALTGFWDFSVSSISFDTRYFYDLTHFRHSVGDMILARIFGDENLFVPEDFGIWVTPENAAETASLFTRIDELAGSVATHTLEVPALRYSHIGDAAEHEGAVSQESFEEQMRALSEAGYSAVSLADIRNHVLNGLELPEKPVIITFDGGYMSNYTYAFPVLKDHGFKAAIFITGSAFGGYLDDGAGGSGLQCFGAAEASEMSSSGLVSIQSRSYAMHGDGLAGKSSRKGVLRIYGESEEEYIAAFEKDFNLMAGLIRESTGGGVFAFAYPHGALDRQSATLLRNRGIEVTFSEAPGVNTLIKGLPQSLLELKRFTVTGDMTGGDILELLTQK